MTPTSPHVFHAGDRVQYSVIVRAEGKRKGAHHQGQGVVLRRCGQSLGSDAPYEIRTTRGVIKMLFARELRLAPPAAIADKAQA